MKLELPFGVFQKLYIQPAAERLIQKVVEGEPLDEDAITLLDIAVPGWRKYYGIAKGMRLEPPPVSS